jgi:hypothetical protein
MTPGPFLPIAAGLLVACTGLVMMIRRTKRIFLGLAWLAVGVAAILAVLKPDFFHGSSPDSLVLRMRLFLGFLSFLVLMITLETVRRLAMEERYALLWVSTGVTLLVFAIYPDAVGWLAALTGMQYISAITAVVFAFLLLVAFHFSLALSEYRADQKRLCQYAATLESRVTELERKLAESPGPRREE